MRIASHDLKNPITCILGFASLIKEFVKPGAVMTETMHESLEKIKSHCKIMEKIIGDFLDFHALEDGQLKLVIEPVDLNEMAQTVLENNGGHAAQKHITLSPGLDKVLPRVDCDKSRVSQVMENFVSNAVKFSLEGGAGSSCAQARATALPAWRSRIRARGLTDEDMQKLFKKYARLSNKPTGGERKARAWGLAIAKKIVDLHDGLIGARNNPDGGATFWFKLPVCINVKAGPAVIEKRTRQRPLPAVRADGRCKPPPPAR